MKAPAGANLAAPFGPRQHPSQERQVAHRGPLQGSEASKALVDPLGGGRRAEDERGRVSNRGLGRVDIGEKVCVSRYVPGFIHAVAINPEQAQQSKSRLELKNQKITGLKIL